MCTHRRASAERLKRLRPARGRAQRRHALRQLRGLADVAMLQPAEDALRAHGPEVALFDGTRFW